jgi:hypothetical protein
MRLGRVSGRTFAMARLGACRAVVAPPGAADEVAEEGGWWTGAPRDAIRPEFACELGDQSCRGTLVIRAGPRDGVGGSWTKTFPGTGGLGAWPGRHSGRVFS